MTTRLRVGSFNNNIHILGEQVISVYIYMNIPSLTQSNVLLLSLVCKGSSVVWLCFDECCRPGVIPRGAVSTLKHCRL